jgi:hypothetical protein
MKSTNIKFRKNALSGSVYIPCVRTDVYVMWVKQVLRRFVNAPVTVLYDRCNAENRFTAVGSLFMPKMCACRTELECAPVGSPLGPSAWHELFHPPSAPSTHHPEPHIPRPSGRLLREQSVTLSLRMFVSGLSCPYIHCRLTLFNLFKTRPIMQYTAESMDHSDVVMNYVCVCSKSYGHFRPNASHYICYH